MKRFLLFAGAAAAAWMFIPEPYNFVGLLVAIAAGLATIEGR